MPCQRFSCTWGCLSACGSCAGWGCSGGAGGSQPDVCSSVIPVVHWSLRPGPSVATGKGASSVPLLSPPAWLCPPAWRVPSAGPWSCRPMPTEPRAGRTRQRLQDSRHSTCRSPPPPLHSSSAPSLLLPKDFSSAHASIEDTAPAAPELAWDSFVLLDSLTRLVLKVFGSGKSRRSGSQRSPHSRVASRGLSCPLEEASPPPG